MLIVAFLFAVSINFDKIVMINSDPFFGMGLTVLAIGGVLLMISAYSFLKTGSTYFRNPGGSGRTSQVSGDFFIRLWDVSATCSLDRYRCCHRGSLH